MKSYSEELDDLREEERELFRMLSYRNNSDNSYVYRELMRVQDRIDDHRDVIRESNKISSYTDNTTHESEISLVGQPDQTNDNSIWSWCSIL